MIGRCCRVLGGQENGTWRLNVAKLGKAIYWRSHRWDGNMEVLRGVVPRVKPNLLATGPEFSRDGLYGSIGGHIDKL